MSSTIFQQRDYRSAIRHWVKAQPKAGRGEFKKMAEHLRIPTPVFSQILSEQRELTEDHAYLLAEYMGLLELEREYFITLVQIERAHHHSYKTFLKKKLGELSSKSKSLSTRVQTDGQLSEAHQAEFYSSWVYSALRLYCDVKKGATFDELLREFQLPREKAQKIISFLLNTGLLKQEGNKYFMGTSRTFIGKDSPYISRHHTNWRVRAMEKAQFLTDDELMFSGPITLSEDDFFRLREKMVALVQDISTTINNSPSERMACFNLDFIFL